MLVTNRDWTNMLSKMSFFVRPESPISSQNSVQICNFRPNLLHLLKVFSLLFRLSLVCQSVMSWSGPSSLMHSLFFCEKILYSHISNYGIRSFKPAVKYYGKANECERIWQFFPRYVGHLPIFRPNSVQNCEFHFSVQNFTILSIFRQKQFCSVPSDELCKLLIFLLQKLEIFLKDGPKS